ncbi:efflux RND transporter periplasmic adaptor subunit [Fodinibius halophilus]|uniref:Efflux RND transporter periplasmic adaptor subunit n=1 Tax=Fodinibius halophilus TaxID=1736908 RepID=A0A6M1TF42_9BACT|nr:efflux RND transporter periplasmic adaptor subunit [Fodinibius halophilus]NGP87230.1 efflux RND transporter periplasmic adaptor subunit [Fodinibius halophilus]
MNVKHRTYFLLFVFITTSIVLSSCGSNNQKQRKNQQPQSYPVIELQPRSIELTSSYPATLEGTQTMEIRPRVSGYIVEILVDEGDTVKKGQPLFKLNSEQYKQDVRSGEANVQAAKAAVKTANDKVHQYTKLVEKNIVSTYQLQKARNNYKAKKAALAQAKSALQNARINLGYTVIKSPANGVMGTIPYRIGSLVHSSIQKPLTKISDISEVYAYFSMSERELLEMTKNNISEMESHSLHERIQSMPGVRLILADNTTYEHNGTLRLASGLINTQTGSASFRAQFPNPKKILRSGGSGNIEIPFQKDSAMVIPKKATYEVQNKVFVYTVSDDNTVQSTEVHPLKLSTKQLFVIKEGLTPGDKIITGGLGSLRKGVSIRPQSINSDSLYNTLSN